MNNGKPVSVDALRLSIFDADDLKKELVPTPEWPKADGAVFVREMSGTDSDQLARVYAQAKSEKPFEANQVFSDSLLRLTVCDADGASLVQSEEHLAKLKEKNVNVVKRLFAAALKINQLDKASQDGAVGNSDGDPTSSSTTASALH